MTGDSAISNRISIYSTAVAVASTIITEAVATSGLFHLVQLSDGVEGYDLWPLRLFLSRGADVNLKNREGETPPDCCSHSSRVWLTLQTNRRVKEARSSTQGEKVLNR